ncbi:hypothetical protein CTAYLR_001339 [Chrysophaeum taylorii]|uniref:Uncharacterized protein n=1 Tax=Chrysophaeum taylorii TaxID=2483200 RepID=A0AAD7U7J7_9STRA|nr:hypothetical protein CTAYLR_001339 [Chrysophaeum taylorii]
MRRPPDAWLRNGETNLTVLCGAYESIQVAREGKVRLANASKPFNPPGKCRGWRLLKRDKGLEVVAVPPEKNGGLIMRAGQRGTLFSVRPCGRDENTLTTFVTLRSPNVRDAFFAETDLRVGGGAVAWTPPAPGNYTIDARLHFLNDRCRGDALYLGPSEPRCAASCASPRLDPTCDKVSRLPLAPTSVVVVDGDDGHLLRRRRRKDPPPQCRDGETAAGTWRNFLGAAAATTAEDHRAYYTGDPMVLIEQSVHRDDPKMFPWLFSRPDCAYHFFRSSEARACLSLEAPTFVAFVGDSLMRGLFANLGRLMGGDLDDAKLKATLMTKNGASHQILFDVAIRPHRARLAYAQMWFAGELSKMTAVLRKAWASFPDKHPTTRLVVVANLGAEHLLHAACGGAFADLLPRGLAAVGAVFAPRKITDLVLVTPSAVLASRNPGMTTFKGQTFAPHIRNLLRALARNDKPRWLRKMANTSVLDLGNLTKARFDATLDGVHYGQTVATTAATLLLNVLCARPRDLPSPSEDKLDHFADQLLVEAPHGDRQHEPLPPARGVDLPRGDECPRLVLARPHLHRDRRSIERGARDNDASDALKLRHPHNGAVGEEGAAHGDALDLALKARYHPYPKWKEDKNS